jgi:DNA polymerase I-like protein with 3'-5' exonuclease and polymerase domains
MSSQVITHEGNSEYSLVVSGISQPRTELIEIITQPRRGDIDRVITQAVADAAIVALDLETNGTDAVAGGVIVGLALAWEQGSFYFSISSMSTEDTQYLYNRLRELPLIAHNVFFDASFLYEQVGWLNWQYCTYGLYMHCANEGFPGQGWGLKRAQVEMLGWAESNTEMLYKWLVNNGYTMSSDETRPDLSQMWRAPAEILGHYCALDADSTWQLWHHVLRPVVERFEVLNEYHQRDYLAEVLVLIEQRKHGIYIDIDSLTTYADELRIQINNNNNEFQELEVVRVMTNDRITRALAEHDQKQPEMYRVVRLGVEPPRFNKKGGDNKNWIKWCEKRDRPREISKSYINWVDRRESILNNTRGDYTVNINSDLQLRHIFYTILGFPVNQYTESGLPSVDDQALRGLGEVGALIARNREVVKELSYVDSYIELARDSILRPSFRVPGTLTGRLSGRDPNIQQIPKSARVMDTFRARDGMVYVDCDHTSIENVVLAELSRDTTLLNLYGPHANPNHDAYLYVGAHLPVIGDAIRRAGYDPENPTPDGRDRAKRDARKERGIAKVVVLASSYGAGPGKIHSTLTSSGVDVTINQVRTIHREYWQLFSGIRKFEEVLMEEWRVNSAASGSSNGWVLNGIGRPICVAEYLMKDIVNRVVQSTAHDIHMMYIRILDSIFSSRGLDVKWIIADFHDQSIVECSPNIANEVGMIMGVEAYEILNAELGAYIPIRGEAQVVTNLTQAKLG